MSSTQSNGKNKNHLSINSRSIYDIEDDCSKSLHHKRTGNRLWGDYVKHTFRLFLFKLRSSELDQVGNRVLFFFLALLLFVLRRNNTASAVNRRVIRQIHLNAKPRIIGYMFDSARTDMGRVPGSTVFWKSLGQSRDILWKEPEKIKYWPPDVWEEGDCVAMHRWQKSSFPTCQKLHEIDIQGDLADQFTTRLNNGFFRDVWVMRDDETLKGVDDRRIFKTLRWKQEYDNWNYDRHRRDAVAMERLTSSPYVLDIYGFCGNSGIFEFGDGGDIGDILWPESKKVEPLTSIDKLKIATQVGMGITAAHNVEHPGVAAMAHTDISPDQFILVDGFYKLNDFNRVRFIRKNKKTGESCPYRVGNNPGEFRSPEEYRYQDQTEKVDVYSMGNIIYALLTNKWPFDERYEDDELKQQMVKDGRRPHVKFEIRHSEDPVIKILFRAMKWCQKDDVEERASAAEVTHFLMKAMGKLSR